MFYLDGKTKKRYQLGRPFTYGDINYTRQGATHDTFIGLGFRQIIPQGRPNDQYYIVSGPDHLGRYTSTPRDIDQLKVSFVKAERQTASILLTPTDWYYARFVELGEAEAVPQEIVDFRVGVRATFASRKAAIEACETTEELEVLFNQSQQTIDSETGEIEDNPDALTSWPNSPEN